eukprot:TRINITY_DN2777_c1_g3_i1.p1 TRINITY_DN2777_c1_g3~~TRINITY_DN2777_c1_g3_i1.p1  ORF type:complete len:137 (+),score=29.97 TRINITY_DN2777_c1_g3_i1:176-586(+)
MFGFEPKATQALQAERELAGALASGKRATLLGFYSQRCRVCQSLDATLEEVKASEGDWLSIVKADVENPCWQPEVGHYDIVQVPCFVLLDSRGRALAKTGFPHSRAHIVRGLFHLVQSMRPFKKRTTTAPAAGRKG